MELWVFIVMLVLSGAVIAAIQNDYGWWTFAISCVMVALGYFYLPSLEWFKANIQTCILLVVSYVILGAASSIFLWWRFCLDAIAQYKTHKEQFLQDHKITDGQIPEELKASWQEHLVECGYAYRKKSNASNPKIDVWREKSISDFNLVLPKASKNKSKIVSWMTFWPLAMLWFILDDLVVNLFNNVYALIVGIFDSISKSMFRRFEEDFSKDL